MVDLLGAQVVSTIAMLDIYEYIPVVLYRHPGV